MGRTVFLSPALFPAAALAEQRLTLSKADEETLDMINGVDKDMLKELTGLLKAKKSSSVASANRQHRAKRAQKGRRLQSRQLSETALVLDTLWLLVCGTFVFFMHAGFAMLEAGTGRAKNVQAILIKNLIAVCAGTLGWYIAGWSLAYGGDVKTAKWEEGGFEDCDMDANPMGCGDGYADNGFVGGASMFVGSGFLGKGEAADKAWAEGTIDPGTYGGGQAYMWFFQWAFCTAGCSIVSGGVAERVQFPAWIFYAFCMTTFIYPVVVCSTWGYGWLETFKKDSKGNPVGGYIDFAGSGVVHLCGGISALVGAKIVGARAGRFDAGGAAAPSTPSTNQRQLKSQTTFRQLSSNEEFQPHSQPLIVLGTFIL